MRVDIEDVFKLEEDRAKVNSPDLSDIEFFKDGERVEIPKEQIDHWRFIGLSNIEFVLCSNWTKGK